VRRANADEAKVSAAADEKRSALSDRGSCEHAMAVLHWQGCSWCFYRLPGLFRYRGSTLCVKRSSRGDIGARGGVLLREQRRELSIARRLRTQVSGSPNVSPYSAFSDFSTLAATGIYNAAEIRHKCRLHPDH
jgi:hypothetical protein